MARRGIADMEERGFFATFSQATYVVNSESHPGQRLWELLAFHALRRFSYNENRVLHFVLFQEAQPFRVEEDRLGPQILPLLLLNTLA